MATIAPIPARKSAWRIWLAGLLALATAMGIGRFAFTPLLPLMLRDGSIGHADGAELAAANYLGYLVGALSAAALGRDTRRLLRFALPLAALLTAAMAVSDQLLLWTALRFAAGVSSAWILVATSSWAMRELAACQRSDAGALVFAGVGIGIALTGGWVWWAGAQPAKQLWLQLGVGAAVAVGVVVWLMGKPRPTAEASPPDTAAAPTSPGPNAAERGRAGTWAWICCYGIFGFGYIVPATYLPSMARDRVDDPAVFGLAWPLFGLAAAASTVLATRWLGGWPRHRVWALAQACMGIGTAIPMLNRSLPAIAAAALLVGGTFMVATMAGLQLARQRVPRDPTWLISRMTAAFAAGQIGGPLLVRGAVAAGLGASRGIDLTAWLAAALLLGSALWLWRGGSAPGS